MGAFDRFWRKEPLTKKTIEIDSDIYDKITELSENKYDASASKLINAAIEELIKTEEIKIYERKVGSIQIKHSLYVRESIITGLDKLKEKYQLSIYKLVDIALRNALSELNSKK